MIRQLMHPLFTARLSSYRHILHAIRHFLFLSELDSMLVRLSSEEPLPCPELPEIGFLH